MSNKKEKPYPQEFKESSVKLAIESDQPIIKTAKELGINSNTLHTWIRKISQLKNPTIDMQEKQNEEIKHLRKELSRITQERDLLKKAAAYFAKEFK